jgi:hypothetical protein
LEKQSTRVAVKVQVPGIRAIARSVSARSKYRKSPQSTSDFSPRARQIADGGLSIAWRHCYDEDSA